MWRQHEALHLRLSQESVNDLVKSGPKGKTKPVESAHPTISNKLDEIFLDAIIDKYKHRILNEPDLINAILALIHKEVLAGRIDELKRMMPGGDYFTYPRSVGFGTYFEERIAELTKGSDLVAMSHDSDTEHANPPKDKK